MASISVFVRIRPMLVEEEDSNQQIERRFEISQNCKQIGVEVSDKRQKIFNFNRIFDQSSSQQDLFSELDLTSMIGKVLDGYHSTIFAYGQTGSGKTYTIEGPENNPGLIFRSLEEIFCQLHKRNNNDRVYKVMLSFVQIYNEGIYDLIDATGKPLKMRWNKHQQFIVENLFEVQCRSKEDALKWWKKGQKNKIMGSHKMNINSSRSHCLFTLKVISYDLEDPSDLIESKFEIVDLAGSERQKVTKATGAVFREGIEINKSLFTLRQVVAALYEISQGENQQKHIPYRDSKLTSLLKQSIGGNTYCSMIACLNPTSAHFEESLQTLNYASMASFINNVPSRNIDPKMKENEQLREQNEQYRKQIKKMTEHIEELTKMLEAGACISCKNQENKNNAHLRRTQTEASQIKDIEEEESEPSGILKLPRFTNNRSSLNESNPNQETVKNEEKLNSVTVEKKTLKTNKDILESILMIKELINANSGLREKIDFLKENSDKQEKEIFELMKENQVFRDRWDLINDTVGPEPLHTIHTINEIPKLAYERTLEEERNFSDGSFYRSRPSNVSKTENSQGPSSKPTSYNQFLKNSAKTSSVTNRRRKNMSMYHKQTGRSDYTTN